MNQGPSSDALKASDSNPSEKYQALGLSQDHTSPYYPPAASVSTSWTDYWSNSIPRENGVGSVSGYNHVQPAALNTTPVASTSGSVSVHAPQDYSGYAAYSSTDPYGNAGYYNSYQQQTTQSYPQGAQPVEAYQNSGAPYQPISSFQNTGSYADYQNSGGYQNGAFTNHTNYWPEGQYTSYTSHQYPNYPSELTSVYSSTSSTASSHYTQQNKQWPEYYNQTQTEVTCAPVTENLSIPGASSQSFPQPGSTTGYPTMYSQPSAAYAPSWRPESNSSEFPSNQPGIVNAGVHDGYWNPGASGFQNQNFSSSQPHVQAPLPINSSYENFQNQQKPVSSQGFSAPYPSSTQVAQTYQPSLQAVPPMYENFQNQHKHVSSQGFSAPYPSYAHVAQTSQPPLQAVPPIDSCRESKLQIPANPRIASHLGFGVPKTEKDISANITAAKPAYVSVLLPKPNDKVSSDDAAADSILKPGMFPKSLCGYVERSLARCKDDVQIEASQAVMKEIITKSTADGTLNTKNWDTEPLFSLPNEDTVNKEGTQFSIPAFSLQKTKRSPNMRGKSRWEPVSEEKLEKSMVGTPKTPMFGGWNKQLASFKSESKVDNLRNGKVSIREEKSSNKIIGKPDSSDPDEKKRREHRSTRFDKGNNGNQSENKHFKPKNGNFHYKRASRNFEDTSVRVAVEDIDWDALTVKGTCQVIEKRYLRLTSAPDPATVRPEQVLEKALLMVKNSEKNYLYKCDQLKSIRQDLTVQRIRNELTVKVYETHARFAIEVGDLSEYNQCQSQLQTLYGEGIEGCHMEFAAYNLLCAILHFHNNRDLLSAMSRLSPKSRKNDIVKHAFAVRGAVTCGNYVSFFRLYKAAPNLSTYLMDLYVEKMRYKAVQCMSRSYRPTVPVSYISHVLGFSSVSGPDDCIEWLKAHGACLFRDDNTDELLFDTKISMSSLYLPEPEDAVSHGDTSLAVDDFLTRNPATLT